MKPQQQWTFLFVIYLIYLLIGGGIYMALEQQNEKDERIIHQKYISTVLTQTVEDLNRFVNNGTFHTRDAKLELFDRVSGICALKGFDILDDPEISPRNTELKWNLYNSVFFAFTVITTIGYGHLSPQTSGGKLFTILYAFIGIPMNGALIYGLGDYFGGKLVQMHKKFKERKYNPKVAFILDITLFVIPGITVFIIFPAGLFVVTENWSFLEAIYFAFTTLATIGFGDYVAGLGDGHNSSIWLWIDKIVIILWITFGLGYVVMMLGFITKGIKSKKVLVAIENKLDTIRSTKDSLKQEIEWMMSVVSDLYVLSDDQQIIGPHNDDYEIKLKMNEFSSDNINNISMHRRKSCEAIPTFEGYSGDRRFSPRIHRSVSESGLHNMEGGYRENSDKALVSIVTQLNRKLSSCVLTAVDELNKYEEEVVAKRNKHLDAKWNERHHNGDAPLTTIPELNFMDSNPMISEMNTTFKQDLEQVIISEEHQETVQSNYSGRGRIFGNVRDALRKISGGRKISANTATTSFSNEPNPDGSLHKEMFGKEIPPREISDKNDPFDFDSSSNIKPHYDSNLYKNGTVSEEGLLHCPEYCFTCGGPLVRKTHRKSNIPDIVIQPTPQQPNSSSKIQHDNYSQGVNSPVTNTSTMLNQRKISPSNTEIVSEFIQSRHGHESAEQSSLVHLLQALDEVHVKLNSDTVHSNSTRSYNDTVDSSNSSFYRNAIRKSIDKRQRRIGVVNPGFYFIGNSSSPNKSHNVTHSESSKYHYSK